MKLPEVLSNSSLLILVGNSEGVLFLTKITQQDLDFYDWFLFIGFTHENLAGELSPMNSHQNVIKNYFNSSDGYDLCFHREDLLAQPTWTYTDGYQLVSSLDVVVNSLQKESHISFVSAPEGRLTLNRWDLGDSSRVPLYFPIGTSVPKDLLQRNVHLLSRLLLCLASPSVLAVNYWGKNCSQVSSLLGPGLYKLPMFITDYFDIRWPEGYTPTLVTYSNKWFSKKPSTSLEYLGYLGSIPTSSFATYVSGLVYSLEKTRCFSVLNIKSKDLKDIVSYRGPMVNLVSPDRSYVIPSQDLYQMAVLVSLGKKDKESGEYISYSALELIELDTSRFSTNKTAKEFTEISLELFSNFFKHAANIRDYLLHIAAQSNTVYKECKHLDNLIKRWSLDLYKRVIKLQLPSATDFPKRSRYNKTVFKLLQEAKKLSFEDVFTRLNNLVQALYYRYLTVASLDSMPYNYFKYLPVLYNAVLAGKIPLNLWNCQDENLDTIVIGVTKTDILDYISIKPLESMGAFKSVIHGFYGHSSFQDILTKYSSVLAIFKPGDIRLRTSDGFELDLHEITLQSLKKLMEGILAEKVYTEVRLKDLDARSNFTEDNFSTERLDPLTAGRSFYYLMYYKNYRLDQLCATYRSLVKGGDTLMLSVVYVPLLKALLPELITMLKGSITNSYYPISLYKSYIAESLEHLLTEIQGLDLDNMQ